MSGTRTRPVRGSSGRSSPAPPAARPPCRRRAAPRPPPCGRQRRRRRDWSSPCAGARGPAGARAACRWAAAAAARWLRSAASRARSAWWSSSWRVRPRSRSVCQWSQRRFGQPRGARPRPQPLRPVRRQAGESRPPRHHVQQGAAPTRLIPLRRPGPAPAPPRSGGRPPPAPAARRRRSSSASARTGPGGARGSARARSAASSSTAAIAPLLRWTPQHLGQAFLDAAHRGVGDLTEDQHRPRHRRAIHGQPPIHPRPPRRPRCQRRLPGRRPPARARCRGTGARPPAPWPTSVISPYWPAYSRQVQPSSTRSASVICSRRKGMALLRYAAIQAIPAYTVEPHCPFLLPRPGSECQQVSEPCPAFLRYSAGRYRVLDLTSFEATLRLPPQVQPPGHFRQVDGVAPAIALRGEDALILAGSTCAPSGAPKWVVASHMAAQGIVPCVSYPSVTSCITGDNPVG